MHSEKPMSLIMIKPDAVRSGAVGSILSIFERAGFRVTECASGPLHESDARALYAEHERHPLFLDLIRFISSGEVVVFILKGEGAISRTRALCGSADPAKAQSGTIRKIFGTSFIENAIHSSSSDREMARERSILFGALREKNLTLLQGLPSRSTA